MFIGLCGLKYSGRRTFASILREKYNFTIVKVSSEPSPPGTESILHFLNVDEMLEWVTERWRDDFVWPELEDVEEHEKVSKRPFFMLIEIKARVSDRMKRSKYEKIDQLIKEDDEQSFKGNGLMKSSPHAAYTFLNFSGIKELTASSEKLGLYHPERRAKLTRPDWDSYFMRIADFAALRTNCMKRGVGAVLVQDNRIISTGYNGTAGGLRNCSDGGCSRCNSNTKCGHSLDSCLCLHAEENALLEAGRSRTTGSTIYCTTAPCLSCARKICQMSVARVVYHRAYSLEHFTDKLFREAGIGFERFEGGMGKNVVIDCECEDEREDERGGEDEDECDGEGDLSME